METSPSAPVVQTAAIENPVVPVIDPNPAGPHTHEGGSVGSVIGILLIVLLLVIGAFYVWGQRLAEERAQQVVPAVGQ